MLCVFLIQIKKGQAYFYHRNDDTCKKTLLHFKCIVHNKYTSNWLVFVNFFNLIHLNTVLNNSLKTGRVFLSSIFLEAVIWKVQEISKRRTLLVFNTDVIVVLNKTRHNN